MQSFSMISVVMCLVSVAMAGHAEHLVSHGMAAYTNGNNTRSINSREDDNNY